MTDTQQGTIGQLLFMVLAMLGSRGRIKGGFPTTDDEGRDVIMHLGGKFRIELAIQVKTSMRLTRHGRHDQLFVNFGLAPANSQSSPCYHYFFAYLDLRRMCLSDYVFLVPSRVMHAHIRSQRSRGKPLITIQASLSPTAHDRWTPYRIKATDLGAHLVQLLRTRPNGVAAEADLSALKGLPGVCWLGLDLGVAA